MLGELLPSRSTAVLLSCWRNVGERALGASLGGQPGRAGVDRAASWSAAWAGGSTAAAWRGQAGALGIERGGGHGIEAGASCNGPGGLLGERALGLLETLGPRGRGWISSAARPSPSRAGCWRTRAGGVEQPGCTQLRGLPPRRAARAGRSKSTAHWAGGRAGAARSRSVRCGWLGIVVHRGALGPLAVMVAIGPRASGSTAVGLLGAIWRWRCWPGAFVGSVSSAGAARARRGLPPAGGLPPRRSCSRCRCRGRGRPGRRRLPPGHRGRGRRTTGRCAARRRRPGRPQRAVRGGFCRFCRFCQEGALLGERALDGLRAELAAHVQGFQLHRGAQLGGVQGIEAGVIERGGVWIGCGLLLGQALGRRHRGGFCRFCRFCPAVG